MIRLLRCGAIISMPRVSSWASKRSLSITLPVFHTKAGYPKPLRRIRFKTDDAKSLVFLANNFALPALTITELYSCRWSVELLFKWDKQHLRVNSFFGTSENALKTQVWIAATVYVVMVIVTKRLRLDASLCETLQILSLTMIETTQLHQLLRIDSSSTIFRICLIN